MAPARLPQDRLEFYMKRDIIKLLKAADDPENCEYPRDFDLRAAMVSVIELK